MLATMINIPETRESILVVVLETDNVDRMAQADPVTLESVNNGGWLPVPLYPLKLSMLIAYETDSAELYARAKGNGLDLLRWLERNRKFDPNIDGKRFVMPIPKKGREH